MGTSSVPAVVSPPMAADHALLPPTGIAKLTPPSLTLPSGKRLTAPLLKDWSRWFAKGARSIVVSAPAVGVTLVESAEQEPVPAALTAATRNTESAPLVRPVTKAVVSVDVGRMNVVHEAPPVRLNWMV